MSLMGNYPVHNVTFNLETGKLRPAKRTYTVWVVAPEDDRWKIYHCPDCKNPVAQYKGDLVAEMPGEAPEPYPIKIQCKNPNCGRKILFKEAILQVI